MLIRVYKILFCGLLVCSWATGILAQSSLAEFQTLLRQKAAFNDSDFAALQQEQPVVRLVPVTDKREVAVSGLVGIDANIDQFLRSYRESMTSKSNAAILEIGRFESEPNIGDLQNLTIEARDIEDLKKCVIGNCKVKLSAPMIERFRNEIDWQSPDYFVKASNLLKKMLVNYVHDYQARGEEALIEYNDARNEISLANEYQALTSADSYINFLLKDRYTELRRVEDAIVWSKIEFGLKPVIAINHITIYRLERDAGPQALITSRQIYANHYFNASLALTAFVSIPGATQRAFLLSENRSRADGLGGPFGSIKKGIVERKALEGLRAILEHSKFRLEGSSTIEASNRSSGWGQRLFGGIPPLLWLLMFSALIALLVLGKTRGEPATRRSKLFKPENAKS